MEEKLAAKPEIILQPCKGTAWYSLFRNPPFASFRAFRGPLLVSRPLLPPLLRTGGICATSFALHNNLQMDEIRWFVGKRHHLLKRKGWLFGAAKVTSPMVSTSPRHCKSLVSGHAAHAQKITPRISYTVYKIY